MSTTGTQVLSATAGVHAPLPLEGLALTIRSGAGTGPRGRLYAGETPLLLLGAGAEGAVYAHPQRPDVVLKLLPSTRPHLCGQRMEGQSMVRSAGSRPPRGRWHSRRGSGGYCE